MGNVTITTDAGTLDLIPATPDELRAVAAGWPMGLVYSQAESEPNGLVFQVGKQEAYGIKLQPPDTDERTARALHFHNLALIAAALPFYLRHRHQGIMVPCAYYKEKSRRQFESGVAFFVSPHPASKSPSQSKADFLYDDELGDGASRMIFDMAGAVAEASKREGMALNTVIGIEVRPRLALGTLGTPFLVHGATIFAIQHPLSQDHPVWGFSVRAGFSKLPYASMVPAAVPGPPNVTHAWGDRVKILSRRLRETSPEEM